MVNFKNEIAKIISVITDICINDIEGHIEIPPDDNMGDYAFPCFRLAKELKKFGGNWQKWLSCIFFFIKF